MKKYLLIAITSLFFISVFSQNEQFQFGKINPEDLIRKNSLVDKTAEAEVLFEYSDVSLALFNGNLEITVKNHVRLKIYNEKGLEEANIKIPYYSRENAEGISKLEGSTYNIDPSGRVTESKLDKKSIYDKKVSNRISNQVFTFPEVKAGSIIEYRYIMKRRLLYFDDWVFQRDIPVRYSNCTIQYPTEFRFMAMNLATLPMETTEKVDGYTMKKTYTMKNIPALKDEPFISCDKDYLQQIQFRMVGYNSLTQNINLSRTWPEIIKELMDDEDFGMEIKKNIKKTSDLDEKLKTMNSPLDKMKTIHHYVRDKMAWDENYSIWAMAGVKQAWADKKGNSGEINLLLINFLKEAGLKAYPLLVSTRSHGRVNTSYPILSQFNTVVAMVTIDSTLYVLDATDKETPSQLIPERLMYTEGLMINKINLEKSTGSQDWGWIPIWNDKQKFSRLVSLSAEMGADGKIKGQAYIMNSDYARLSTLKSWKAEKDKYQEGLSSSHIGIKIDELKFSNDEKDSVPLSQQFNFEVPSDESGEYRYFSVNLFSGLEKNPFIAGERSSDITYGMNQKYTMRGVINIPEGQVFEELPKDIKMVMPDKGIVLTRIMYATGNRVNYSITLEFNKPFFEKEEYPEFREFYKKLQELLSEQIVIKKIKS